MRLTELLRLVWIHVRQNRLKVLLNSLGIIVGTITIVLVIAIGQGAEQEAARQYSSLSADTLYLKVDYGAAMRAKQIRVEPLTPELLQHILDESSVLTGMYLRQSTMKQVKFGKEKADLTIVGVTEGYSEISNLALTAGFDFSEAHYEQGANAVILGYNVAKTYFKNEEEAVGKTLTIQQKRYQVIGVLQRSGDGLQGISTDDALFIPYANYQAKGFSNEYDFPEAVGKASSVKKIKLAIQEIRSTLDYYLQHGELYDIEDAGSRIEAATASARTMNALLISMAAIVFVVSGIGIMNVLFVTIRERTCEIGILKALGTRRKDILVQFLLESSAIGVFGGCVGVLLSFIALPLLERSANIPIVPVPQGMIIALIFAVGTGTLFGFYPAYCASKLIPVNALNVE
ncbi:ABC transporter permease [Holdemania massiliensis]|uniref:ABC transporter permease n=1 Tax=Holdemania massiliensis TaxID=1468449 RepID=UPI001F06378F|nr:ABC transporter permease [Holdemania massiliensis]MCH1942347.1 ABC transporter permease [Holdemania massiliensis]